MLQRVIYTASFNYGLGHLLIHFDGVAHVRPGLGVHWLMLDCKTHALWLDKDDPRATVTYLLEAQVTGKNLAPITFMPPQTLTAGTSSASYEAAARSRPLSAHWICRQPGTMRLRPSRQRTRTAGPPSMGRSTRS